MNQTRYVINSQPALSQVLVKESNGIKTFYVYGLGLIGEETKSQYRTYHFDYRGSTVALTDETGQVTQRFQYAPYGELVSGDATQTPFLFNGMYGVMTDDNGLYYMRARFYSPEIKRFVNQDVLLGEVSEGQTLNRFAFVTGNPVSFVDPFGLAEYCGQCAISAYDCLLYGGNLCKSGITNYNSVRGPDFINFQIDIYVVSGWLTYNTKNGSLFVDRGLNKICPSSLASGISMSFGWLNACGVTPNQVDNFLGGYAGTVFGGYRAIGGSLRACSTSCKKMILEG